MALHFAVHEHEHAERRLNFAACCLSLHIYVLPSPVHIYMYLHLCVPYHTNRLSRPSVYAPLSPRMRTPCHVNHANCILTASACMLWSRGACGQLQQKLHPGRQPGRLASALGGSPGSQAGNAIIMGAMPTKRQPRKSVPASSPLVIIAAACSPRLPCCKAPVGGAAPPCFWQPTARGVVAFHGQRWC